MRTAPGSGAHRQNIITFDICGRGEPELSGRPRGPRDLWASRLWARTLAAPSHKQRFSLCSGLMRPCPHALAGRWGGGTLFWVGGPPSPRQTGSVGLLSTLTLGTARIVCPQGQRQALAQMRCWDARKRQAGSLLVQQSVSLRDLAWPALRTSPQPMIHPQAEVTSHGHIHG